MTWRRMLLFTQWFQSPFKKIIFPALTFSVIFPALTFLVHRYFSLLSMWLIVTLEWLCFSAPEIITLIRNGQSLNWLRLRTWHPCIHSVLGCYVWLSSVEARWCHLCWFPPGIQRQEVVWVPSLWWPWCPRVQIASSQGNSSPGNRCECVWRLRLHKIPNVILSLELQWPGLTESYFHLYHRC